MKKNIYNTNDNPRDAIIRGIVSVVKDINISLTRDTKKIIKKVKDKPKGKTNK